MKKLAGKSLSNSDFKIIEDFKTPNVKVILDMLNPKYSGPPIYIIRKYIDKKTVNKVVKEFRNIIDETNGGNRKNGDVPVLQIGSTQFRKTSQEYINECISTKANVLRLINSLDNTLYIDDFMLNRTLKNELLNKGMNFRPSMFNQNEVNPMTARKWINNKKGLALLPHEDLSQLMMAKSDNYEIFKVLNVIASNLCLSNDTGGELVIWNIDPSYESKKCLKIENDGYPYPPELLLDFQKLSIYINPGDLYFINANMIHGVKGVESGERITMGKFMGYSSESEIIYWT